MEDQPWMPEDWEELPHRVRDNEEYINELKKTQREYGKYLRWIVGGIWMLVAQMAGAAITYWLSNGGM